MKILQVHNFYQRPGGEDQVYSAEFDLLKQHGDEVEQYSVHNAAIGEKAGVAAALRTIWNSRTLREAREIIRRFRPDVVHCHNTFPIVSPAIYYAAAAEQVPLVQTVQNYRLICPSATLYRDGRVCEDCVGHLIPYHGVLHGCYRGNRLASGTVATMLTMHRIAGTWRDKVATYIAPTEFVKSKLIEGGLPAAKVLAKPNFLSFDPGPGSGDGGYALYVGRLSHEKGIGTLLQAWEDLTEVPLKIVGEGPLHQSVTARAKDLRHVSILGFMERTEIFGLVKAAKCLIVPSEWYEGFPMTTVEAMACGTPVVASDLGSLREVIKEGLNGLRFEPGNSHDLVWQVRRLLSCPEGLRSMRKHARTHYEANYTPAQNYPLLREIYEIAIKTYQA